MLRRFDYTDEVDMVVIGCGAGGGVPTQGAANPALTIMALVARAADAMVRRAGEGS